MNRFLHALSKVGHGIEKGAVVTGKVAFKTAEVAAPIAAAIFPAAVPLETFLATFHQHALEGAITMQEETATAAPALDHAAAPVQLNMLEQMGISMLLVVLQTTIKNPGHKAALQAHLMQIADQIYMTYGIVPTPRM